MPPINASISSGEASAYARLLPRGIAPMTARGMKSADQAEALLLTIWCGPHGKPLCLACRADESAPNT